MIPSEHQILGDRHFGNQPLTLAILGNVGHARSVTFPRRVVGYVAVTERNGSGSRTTHACQRFHQLGLSVALHTGDTDDFPCTNFERHAIHHSAAIRLDHRQVLHLQHGCTRCRWLLVHHQLHGATHHHLGNLRLGGVLRVGLANHLASAQHIDAIGDGECFLQLVGNEDDSSPGRHQRANDLEELQDFTGREHRRGLVEHHDLCVTHEHLDDLHALAHTHREVFNDRIRIEFETVFIGDFLHHSAGFINVERAKSAGRLDSQHHVFGHGHNGDQHEVLVHHADTCSDGVGRRREMLRNPVNAKLAFIGAINAVQHVHERALAGTVLADEGQHLARGHLEVHAVVGDDAGETLGDSPQFKLHLVRHPSGSTE